jgi:hypothetical protein
MPTQRSFFSNFLAAFRAHSALQKATSSISSGMSATTSNPSPSISHTTARAISSKSQPSTGATTAAVQAAGHLQSTRQTSTSPLSRSPITPSGSPTNPIRGQQSRRRRSSSSSTEGFRDVLGPEKWYIGGRNAAGEEKYYRLSMVRRHRSIDRLSMDRLSL